MNLVSNTLQGVERALDGLTLRQTAIADNVANINTPGYVKQEVNFEDSLREALGEANTPSSASYEGLPQVMDGVSVTAPQNDVLLTWQPKMAPSPDGPQRLDGNRTTIETEMSGMAMNAIKYQALTQIVQKQYALLKQIAQAK